MDRTPRGPAGSETTWTGSTALAWALGGLAALHGRAPDSFKAADEILPPDRSMHRERAHAERRDERKADVRSDSCTSRSPPTTPAKGAGVLRVALRVGVPGVPPAPPSYHMTRIDEQQGPPRSRTWSPAKRGERASTSTSTTSTPGSRTRGTSSAAKAGDPMPVPNMGLVRDRHGPARETSSASGRRTLAAA